MARSFSVALAQYVPLAGPDPVAALRDQAVEINSVGMGLDLIVFPEIHLCGDADTAEDSNAWLKAAAEPLDGPRMRTLAKLADDLGVSLIPGSVPELGDDGRVYNTEVVFNRRGALVAS